jgi:hypothetical protein
VRHLPRIEHRRGVLSLRPHVKGGTLPASLSTRDFLSARSARPTSQVPAVRGRPLQRLRVRHGRQWQRNLSEDCHPPTFASTSGYDPQRQGAFGRLSPPRDAERPPSCRSHPGECPAPSLCAHAAHARGTSILQPYPMALTRRQASATRPTRSGIYIGRPPRLRPIPSTAASHRRRCIARVVQGARQRSRGLPYRIPRDTCDGVQLTRRRRRRARCGLAARCHRVLTPVPRPSRGRHRSGVCVPLGGPAGVRPWQSHRRGAPRACRAASAGRAHHARR